MRFETCYVSPIGNIYISEQHGKICGINYTKPQNYTTTDVLSPLLQKAIGQLQEYFAGQRQKFDLPLSFNGTSFRQKVWRALLDIPYGQTVSYLDIAIAIGNPRAVRAVGQANHFNPISIVVPCHRVVGKNGQLVGYGGGLSIKEYLLNLEKDRLNA